MPSKQGQSLLRILFFWSDLGIHISDISLGALHVVGLSTLGNIYTWGYNANGQLGTWDTLNRAYPVRVKKREPVSCVHTLLHRRTQTHAYIFTHTHTHTQGMLFVSAVAAGAYHSHAVSDRGDLYSFGSNRNGQAKTLKRSASSHAI